MVYSLQKETEDRPRLRGTQREEGGGRLSPVASRHYANSNVGRELGQHISLLLQEKAPKIKVIDQRKIARWADENKWKEFPEVAKAMKADMVVGVDLESSVCPGANTLSGQGQRLDPRLRLQEERQGGTHKSIPQCIYPPNGAIATSERTEPDFRSEFVGILADQIARYFFPTIRTPTTAKTPSALK